MTKDGKEHELKFFRKSRNFFEREVCNNISLGTQENER